METRAKSKFIDHDSRPKIRTPKESARTLSFNRSIRDEFRNRKLQETRSRCRLIEQGSSRERLDEMLGPRLYRVRFGRN